MSKFESFTKNMTKLDSEAWEWIIRLDADDPLSSREKHSLIEWLARSPVHVEKLRNLNEFWGNQTLVELLAPPLRPIHQTPKTSAKWLNSVYAISFAVLFGFVGIFWWQYPLQKDLPRVSVAKVTSSYNTAVGEQKRFELADGSQILMNADSQLKVALSPTARNIWLVKGEAHFNVVKNTSRPFNVYTENGRVQAVGTAFTVEVIQNNVEVLVTHGRIKLALAKQGDVNNDLGALFSIADSTANKFDNKMQHLAFMDAGEFVKFDQSINPKQARVVLNVAIRHLSNAEINARQAWKHGEIIFNGETFKEVIEELKRYSSTVIEIADPSIENLKVGGRFKVDQLDTLLRNLELNFNVKVEEPSAGKIVISRRKG